MIAPNDGAWTLRQAWTEIYLPSRPQLTAGTQVRHRCDLQRWERCTANPPIAAVVTGDLDHFRRMQLESGVVAGTAEGAVSTVMAILHECQRQGVIKAVPDRGRKLFVMPPVPDVPTVESLALAYSHTGAATWPHNAQTWWRVWFVSAYTTGLRLGDLERLEWSQIEKARIVVRAHKTGKLQTLPVHPALVTHLDMLRVSGASGRILRCGRKQLYQELSTICRAAGIDPITPQAMRRLAATEYERAHAGAGALLLGHSLPRATAYYLHAPDILRLACDRLEIPQVIREAVPFDGQRQQVLQFPEQDTLDNLGRLLRQVLDRLGM